MIQANELRIGNLILLDIPDSKNKYLKVSAKILYEGGISEYYAPIPLTEEILLKCGFEYDTDLLDYRIGDFNIETNFANIPKFSYYISSLNKDIVLTSLHQLQNLYFVLTKKELEIKL